MICLFEGEHNIDPVERLQEARGVGAGLQNKASSEVRILTGRGCGGNRSPSCFGADLSLEYLRCGDGERHNVARLLHSETICLVHQHAADRQCFRVVAASFGQTHLPFEDVEHGVFLHGGGHYNVEQNALLSSIVCTFMSILYTNI